MMRSNNSKSHLQHLNSRLLSNNNNNQDNNHLATKAINQAQEVQAEIQINLMMTTQVCYENIED